MMDKSLRSELVSETGSGNYKCTLSLISRLEKFDEPLAIRVFIECCRPLCVTKTSCSIIEEDLYNLLNKCVPLIEAPEEKLLVGYLQSTYYIIKFLVDKGNVRLVSSMEAMLIPRFVNLINSAKTKKLYEILCSLIHNVVVDLLQEENKSGGDQMIYYFCSLSLKMKSNLVLDYNCLLDSAYSYFKCSNFTRIDLKLQYDCYVMVLNLFKKPNTTKDIKGCFSAIMRLLETVAQNLFRHKAFDKIKEYLKTSITTIKDMCQMSRSIDLCCNILYITGELIVELKETEDMFELLKNNFSICFKHLKRCFENHGVADELQRTSAVLYVIFRHLIQSYIEVDVNVWNKCMTVQNQTLIYKLLSGISKMISKTEVKCVDCSNCKVTHNLYTSVSATVLIGKLLRKTLVAEQTTAKILAPLAIQHFEDSCTLITSLKHGNCTRWKYVWSEVAIMIYNIAVKLYSFKYIECSTYFSLLIRNIVQLEGVNTSTSVFNFNAVSASLKCLSDIYLQTLQFKEALMFSSLQILLDDDSGKKFQQWISVKVKNKHSDIINDSALQEATVVCILEQNKNEIEKLYPLIENRLDSSIKQNLLTLELEQYKALWPSRVPMMAVFKKLFEMADIEAVVKVLIGTWGDNLTSAHDGVLELLNPISTKLKNRINEMNEDKTAMQIFMGLLHVMCYYYETRQLRQSTVTAIKKSIICEQLPALPHEVPKHPNDECDIISSYESLKIKEHLKVWKHLNKALRIFKLYTPHCTSIQLINLLKEFNVDNNIVKIAKEAFLHCHTLDSMLASSVGFSVSKLIGNKLCMLQFLLPVIEDAKTNLVTVEQLLAEAEILASEVKLLDMSDESWQVLTEYYISKSKVFFRHHKFQKGFKEYERALSCFTNITKNELLKVRLDLLYVQYLQLPCNLSGENHDVSMLSKFSRLFQHITYFKHSDHYSIHTKAILFEVNQVIIETYKWMNLPREVRCYSRNLITCAQEEVVPLRAAQLLAYLIHADLLSMRLDDCQVKLSGLAEILCLDNNMSISSQSNLEKQNSVKEDNSMMSLINDFSEVMLDCPANDTDERNLTGSPILLTKPFKLPSFLNHSLECDCFYCTSIEYKYLVMEYIQLEAQLHIQYNNMTAAEACFQGAMLFCKKMNNRNETFKMHLINCFSYDPLCDMKDILAESFSSLLLSYVNYLISINDTHKAKFFNEQLTSLINDKKYKNPHLYNKAFAQKLIIMYTISEKMNDGGCLLFTVTSCMKPNKVSNELKTPENRQTKINVQSNYSPIATPPPKRQLRKIKCDFSEKKRESKDKCSTSTSNNNQPFEIEVCSKTEKSDECGTQKPSNKLVYNTPIIKSISTKETVLQEIPISIGKNNNCIKQRDSSGVIPESPNAYTPKVIMVSSVLESRTKLLTKKLNKKKIINDGDDTCEVNNINKDQNKTKKDIRKNLMDELSAIENKTVGKCANKKRCNVQDSDGRDTSRIPVKTRTRTKKNK